MTPTPIRVGACALALLLALPAARESIPLARDGASASVIVYPGNDPLAERTARKLSDYAREHAGVSIPVVAEAQLGSRPPNTTIVLIDGTPEHRLAAKFGQSVTLPAGGDDAYALRTVTRPNAAPLIIAAGRGPAGAKYAAYQLMRELEIDGGDVRVGPLEVSAAPFIRTRSIALFNVWNMPIELTRRHNTESWPIERIERYLDMYDVYGFNAIESHDRFNDNYLEPLFGLSRSDWREKVQRMCDHAHQSGQEFFLRIWGHSVMETPKISEPLGPNGSVPKRLAYFCVNDPAERKRWEEEIRDYYVRHYAGRIDHLIGHWCDPGVCRRNGCDYRTPLTLHTELHRAFKAVDPDFRSSFSLWFFDVTKNNPKSWARGGWRGYETDFDLINAGILDRDITIATVTLAPGSYKDDVVSAIAAAGHKSGLWTWYRADHETRPSLHVHLHERLGEYFRSLPASARNLEWHNVERNVHGAANTANYYVAGRLMWDPSLDVASLLEEFLRLGFGPANAPRLMPAYDAIERIRCHSCYKNWQNSRLTGAGTADPRADLAQAQAALDQLARVKLAPGHRSRIPLDPSPEQIVADLQASLEVIRDFARCRAEEMPAVDRALAANDHTTAARLIEQLETRYQPWTLTLAGRQEWSVLDVFLEERKRRLDPK